MRIFLAFLLSGTLLSLYSCSKNNFLNNHNIILVTKSIDGNEIITDEAKLFEKNHKVKLQDANIIYMNIISKNQKTHSVDLSHLYPSLIIDEYYVYSFKNTKTQKVAAFGIGINADTGVSKNFTEEIWLDEKDILEIK